MTETMVYRPHPPLGHYDRPRSTSSNSGSHKSTFSHYKVSSQTSLAPPSPRISHRSSQRVSTVYEDGPYRPSKRLRSQYPLNSSESHVEYILVASFDIDRGPIMEHQYPGAISPDENMLAELMLPDQTHVRQQDWTMFFLHKDAGTSEEDIAERAARRRQRHAKRRATDASETPAAGGEELEDDTSSDESDVDSLDSPPLMYVLNLVNTKQDSTVKRGAVVKAMAICTRHSFLHIYKPLLLLALEDYFKSPTPDTLELLYNALNAMDLSLMPRLSLLERHILQATDVKDMFIEKFEQMISQRLTDEALAKDPDAPESPVKAEPKYSVPRDTHEFESKIVYNGIPIPVKIPTALSPETVGDFSLIKLVQIFGTPHQTQPHPFALHPHLTTSGAFTHPIVVLINAMLTEKRVIFLGHNRPSGEVAEAVLAACALASGGVLRGFTRHAFPYTDLTKIDELLKVPGFIAGVTNPAFSYHPEWWDLLCDLPSGRMKISSCIEAAPVTEGTTFFHHHGHSIMSQKDLNHADATGDVLFMDDVSRGIASRAGESIIRAKFRAYITKFTRIAAAFEETVYGASSLSVLPPTEVEKPDAPGSTTAPRPMSLKSSSKHLKGHGYVWPNEEAKTRELAASAARIEGWRNTRSYYAFISDLAAHASDPKSPTSPVSMANMLAHAPAKPYVDLYHSLAKLRTLHLTPAEAGAIYLALEAYCTDYESILELLEMAPMSEAGLFYVGLGLWHEDRRVRNAVTTLLDRVRKHPAGRLFFNRLGGWATMGFQRRMLEREANARVRQAEADDMLGPLAVDVDVRRS
ncbi:Protein mesA [Cladophialophora carrionii]|uniref:Protein mesA n=1 Tax=Cladophialophora carrionii TaxID=86049 RepID=A0A1C1CJQ3_9EURO|nr:Protein mesA [Cladophialophora carrionii]